MSSILRKCLTSPRWCRLKHVLIASSHATCMNRLTNTPKYSIHTTAYFAQFAHSYKNENFQVNEKIDTDDHKVDRLLSDMDAIVRRVGRIGTSKVEHVTSILESIGSASETQGLYLLRSCGVVRSEPPSNRVKLANKVWEKLQNLDCKFTVGHYNSLLKLYLDCDHAFAPTEFLSLMERNDIEPNTKTYAYLIERYCNEGDLDGAGEILQFLKEKNLPIGEKIFNALIKGNFRANDIEGARGILDMMHSSNLSPTASSYTTLACEYARVRDVENVKSVLAEADNKVIFSNNHYLAIMTAFPSEQQLEEFIFKLENIQEWKHDILNSVYDLVHKGHDDGAFKLLETVNGTNENYHTSIFLRQLIKGKRPIDKILQYCENIENKYSKDYIYLNACRLAMDFEDFNAAVTLLDVMHKKGLPVRLYYFRPILQYYKSISSEEGVMLTLKKMSELGIPIDTAMFWEYVFPSMSVTNPESVIKKIKETGQSASEAIDPLFQYYCHSGHFKNALFMTQKYSFKVPSKFDFQRFLSFRFDHQSEPTYLKVLIFLFKNIGLYPEEKTILQGKILAQVLLSDRSLSRAFQQCLSQEGDIIDKETLNVAWDTLQSHNPGLLPVLKNLGGTQFNSRPVRKEAVLIKDLSDPQYVIGLFSEYIKDKNISEVKKMEEKLFSMGVDCPAYIHVQLLNFYCQLDNLESASKSYRTLKEKNPTFKITTIHALNYATLLLKFSKTEECVEVLKIECQNLNILGNNEALKRSIRNLFSRASEFGDIKLIGNLQSILMPHFEEFGSRVVLLEPVIKFHLSRKELESAVKAFKKSILDHQVAPCIDLLLKQCIANDNANELEEVMDVASSLLGRNVVLHKLFQSLVEMRRINQAREVLNNLGKKADQKLLEDACSYFLETRQTAVMESFLDLTLDLKHVNKDALYFFMFKLYEVNKDFKRAAALYDNIIETSLFELSDKTKQFLSNFFGRNKPLSLDSTKQNIAVPLNATAANDQGVKEFLYAVEAGDANLSLEKLHPLKKGFVHSLPMPVVTKFIDLLVKNKAVFELIQNDQIMSYIINNSREILEPLLVNYSEAGDVESLNFLAGFLPDFCLRKTSFNGAFAKAYIVTNRVDDLLAELEHRWDMKNKLFSLQAFNSLLENPAFEQRTINLAEKYLQANFDLPISVVWAHYLINGHPDKAKDILKSHPVKVAKVDSLVLKAALRREDDSVARVFVDLVNEQNAQPRYKEKAYKTLLNIYVSKQMYQEANALIKEANEKDIDLELYYQIALKTVKTPTMENLS